MTISRFLTGVNLAAGNDAMVDGCYIGTDPFALSGLGNIASGIWAHSMNRPKIGTISPNVIADNNDGVYISNSPHPTVTGNFIGVRPSGAAIGNLRNGVRVEMQSDHGRITGNHIVGSGASGILFYGPFAGVWGDLTGNEIRASGCLPIHLQPTANTGCVLNINDPGDPDTGLNNLQNHSILTGFTQGRTSTTINGTLNSEPSSPYLIEFYANSGPNNLGFVEPRVFLGSITVNTNSSGNATFSYTPYQSIAGQWVTASATQKGTAGLTGLMATSEFFKGIKAP